jgi:hypothetical protein
MLVMYEVIGAIGSRVFLDAGAARAASFGFANGLVTPWGNLTWLMPMG